MPRKYALPTPGDVPHGTNTGYTSYQCRCDECKNARKVYMNEYRVRRREQTAYEDIPHGSEHGYKFYTCRCDECVKAHRNHKARERRGRIKDEFDEFPHGTATGYQNHRCRCLECRKAQRDYTKSLLRDKYDMIYNAKCVPCMDCGLSFENVCMDFDHRDGRLKLFNLSVAVKLGKSVQEIQAEMDKCDVVCSNCHRMRTRDRREAAWLEN